MNRLCLLLLILVLFSGLQMTVLSSAPPISYDGDGLVQTYLDLSTKQIGVRQRYFSNLTPETQASLVKLHLSILVASEATFTPEQKYFLLECIRTISRSDYTEPSEKTTLRDQEIEMRASQLFGPRRTMEILDPSLQTLTSINFIKEYVEYLRLAPGKARQTHFVSADPETKKSIWRARLAVILATEMLNLEQQQIVIRGLNVVSANSTYADHKPERRDAALDEFERAALTVFSEREVVRLFATLDNGLNCTLPQSTVPEEEQPDCSCYYSAWCQLIYNSNWVACLTGGCRPTRTGCGIFGNSSCDGRCGGPF